MSPIEIRATYSLASLFALRMLGLFMILPVFSVYGAEFSGAVLLRTTCQRQETTCLSQKAP